MGDTVKTLSVAATPPVQLARLVVTLDALKAALYILATDNLPSTFIE